MNKTVAGTDPALGEGAGPMTIIPSPDVLDRSFASNATTLHVAAKKDRYGALRIACEDALVAEAEESWPDTEVGSSPSGTERSPDDPAILISIAIALTRHGLAMALPPALLERLVHHAAAGNLASQALLERQRRLEAGRRPTSHGRAALKSGNEIEIAEYRRASE